MKTRRVILVSVLILILQACNLPSAQPVATEPAVFTQTPIPPTQIQFTATPSFTPLPTDTSLPQITSTPNVPVATPIEKGVNCRLGPGLEWVITGALLPGQHAPIQGKNGDASWWYVSTPNDPGKPCWVAASVTSIAGNVNTIPVVAAPEASVIDVQIGVDPDTVSVAGCTGPVLPIQITGTIVTNGPTTVKWHFETQQGGSGPSDNLVFNKARDKEVTMDYTPVLPAGTYWVRLVITAPNNDSAETQYKIECP